MDILAVATILFWCLIGTIAIMMKIEDDEK